MRRTLFFVVTTLLLVPRTSAAQDTPRFGIVMGYPAQVGVLWSVAERVAIRPEISVSKSASESTTTIVGLPPISGVSPTATTATDGWQLGVGVSGLFYVTKGDALRTYVSPRYSYARSSTTVEGGLTASRVPISTGPITSVVTNHTMSGSLGAQYTLGKRFGLFGELGLSYTHSGESPASLTSITLTETNLTSWTLTLRSGAGVILFF